MLYTPDQTRVRFVNKLNGKRAITPMEVMYENMVFYHQESGKLLATIMGLPTATRSEAEDAQFRAFQLLADHLKMRDKAGEAAQALARYVHRPMAALPAKADEVDPSKALNSAEKPTIELIPVHPQADAAFKRAAEGLPPSKREKL